LEDAINSGKREDILGRIREALRVPAHPPHDGQAKGRQDVRAWLPDVPPDVDGQLALFQRNCALLRTELHLVDGLEQAAQTLGTVRDVHGWTSAAVHRHPLLDPLEQSLGLKTWHVEERLDIAAMEKCSVGVTACDALIAQTGSILLTARSAGGRALSVLPPHHLVVAQVNQLMPDLPAAFDLLQAKYRDNYPSFITFITGPSRTGDIERILVLGAHGPKNLTLILIR
jgi:L-lactate dehydrogenase complex protein LldG